MFPELAALRPGLAIKPVLAQLTTTFPDLEPTIEDSLQHRNEVIVRPEWQAYVGQCGQPPAP